MPIRVGRNLGERIELSTGLLKAGAVGVEPLLIPLRREKYGDDCGRGGGEVVAKQCLETGLQPNPVVLSKHCQMRTAHLRSRVPLNDRKAVRCPRC